MTKPPDWIKMFCMNRVLIIGSGGAGKSTLGRQLRAKTGLPLIHLDREYWRSGWIKPDSEEWRCEVGKMLAGERWILDGNFGGTLEMRLAACDTVILLDLNPLICLYRVVRRRFRYRGTNRPDMAEGCNEQIDLDFLLWIITFRRKKLAAIENLLKTAVPDRRVVRLQSRKAVEEFIGTLTAKRQENTG